MITVDDNDGTVDRINYYDTTWNDETEEKNTIQHTHHTN